MHHSQLQLFQPTDSETIRLYEARSKITGALLAPNSVSGYGYDWRMFVAWCEQRNYRALPASADTVSLYLTDLLDQGKKVTTANRRTCAIAYYHHISGDQSPITDQIRDFLRGAQRLRKEKPREMLPLGIDQLRLISEQLGRTGSRIAVRNRAIMVFGFASALRRSTIGDMLLDDVEFDDHGLVVNIRQEKQDQEGKGRLIGIPRGQRSATCPVRTLQQWLDFRGHAPGFLFQRLSPGKCGQRLNGDAICRVVKKCVGLIGLDPSNYGAHSLRAGFITEAGEHDVGQLVIAAHTGHRSLQVLQRYFRRQDLWRVNACARIGL